MENNNNNVKEAYYLRDLLNEKAYRHRENKTNTHSFTKKENDRFILLCQEILDYFNNLKIGVDDLERQKKAIIGYPEEVNYYKDKIDEYLKVNNLIDEEYPMWYSDLPDAVFHEIWGLAGIAQWYKGSDEELKNSSTAKIIGDKIFFMIDGKMTLMPQKISSQRREQLKRALLSNDFKVRLDNDVPDIEMITGERIKIFGQNVTRKNSDTIIFRKFPVRDYSFEKQIELGTYPKDILNLCRAVAKIGYNMVFTGAVRTSKTTQLSTWLNYESSFEEGLIVETRPEIPIDQILPDAPIISLVADTEEKLARIRSSIMRSDADFVIMAEARDAYAYDIALKSASVGTRRCKMTAHINTPYDFPYEFAKEITRVFGGDVQNEAISVAKAFTLNLHFINYPQHKAKKRLEGIYVFEYNPKSYEIFIHTLCKYNVIDDSWSYNYCVTDDMKKIGIEQNYEAFKIMCDELKKLQNLCPMDEETSKPLKPFYSK